VGAGVENWKGDSAGDIFDDRHIDAALMFMLMLTK
jgi:hypothetical protein